jgi:hypothetical protein
MPDPDGIEPRLSRTGKLVSRPFIPSRGLSRTDSGQRHDLRQRHVLVPRGGSAEPIVTEITTPKLLAVAVEAQTRDKDLR